MLDVISPIGSIPEDWQLVRLKDITTKIGSGATPRGGDSVYLPERESFALVRSQNVFDHYFDDVNLAYISDKHAQELAGVSLQPGDLLLNITGDGITFGRVCIVPEHILPACVNQHVTIIRLDPSICTPGYLLAYLTLPQIKEYIESFNAGGSRRAITKGHIESFEIPLPPIDEQEAIHDLVLGFNDKIELNRRMNATLEEAARTLFQSWFVDFDPVRAKAEGRQPDGMDEKTAALFPDQLIESPLGPIPEGWQVGTIGEDFKLTMGQSPPGDTYNEDGNGLPFYQGNRDFGFRFPARRIYCTEPSRIAQPGDTLVSVRAPVGEVNMAAEQCCIGRGVAAVRHKSGSRSYTYYAVNTLEAHFANFEGEGTVFGSLSGQDFKQIPFLIPPVEIANQFEAFIYEFDQQIDVIERESQTLAATRNTLLPKLLSGEVRLN